MHFNYLVVCCSCVLWGIWRCYAEDSSTVSRSHKCFVSTDCLVATYDIVNEFSAPCSKTTIPRNISHINLHLPVTDCIHSVNQTSKSGWLYLKPWQWISECWNKWDCTVPAGQRIGEVTVGVLVCIKGDKSTLVQISLHSRKHADNTHGAEYQGDFLTLNVMKKEVVDLNFLRTKIPTFFFNQLTEYAKKEQGRPYADGQFTNRQLNRQRRNIVDSRDRRSKGYVDFVANSVGDMLATPKVRVKDRSAGSDSDLDEDSDSDLDEDSDSDLDDTDSADDDKDKNEWRSFNIASLHFGDDYVDGIPFMHKKSQSKESSGAPDNNKDRYHGKKQDNSEPTGAQPKETTSEEQVVIVPNDKLPTPNILENNPVTISKERESDSLSLTDGTDRKSEAKHISDSPADVEERMRTELTELMNGKDKNNSNDGKTAIKKILELNAVSENIASENLPYDHPSLDDDLSYGDDEEEELSVTDDDAASLVEKESLDVDASLGDEASPVKELVKASHLKQDVAALETLLKGNKQPASHQSSVSVSVISPTSNKSAASTNIAAANNVQLNDEVAQRLHEILVKNISQSMSNLQLTEKNIMRAENILLDSLQGLKAKLQKLIHKTSPKMQKKLLRQLETSMQNATYAAAWTLIKQIYQEQQAKAAGVDWDEWGEWSACSAHCGASGYKLRRRLCRQGGVCSGPNFDLEACENLQNCEAEWVEWSVWGECSASCGKGKRLRTRVCLTDKPDKQCQGNPVDNEECRHLPPCEEQPKEEVTTKLETLPSISKNEEEVLTDSFAGEDQWSPWGVWSICSVTCGQGNQERRRDCTQLRGNSLERQPISHVYCLGKRRDRRKCNTVPCSHPVAIKSSLLDVPEGSTVKLTCNYAGDLPIREIYWINPKGERISKKTVDEHYTLINSSLIIASVRPSDLGLYHCILVGLDEEQSEADEEAVTRTCGAFPCRNGATCEDVHDNKNEGGYHYRCICSEGFYGRHCEQRFVVEEHMPWLKILAVVLLILIVVLIFVSISMCAYYRIQDKKNEETYYPTVPRRRSEDVWRNMKQFDGLFGAASAGPKNTPSKQNISQTTTPKQDKGNTNQSDQPDYRVRFGMEESPYNELFTSLVNADSTGTEICACEYAHFEDERLTTNLQDLSALEEEVMDLLDEDDQGKRSPPAKGVKDNHSYPSFKNVPRSQIQPPPKLKVSHMEKQGRSQKKSRFRTSDALLSSTTDSTTTDASTTIPSMYHLSLSPSSTLHRLSSIPSEASAAAHSPSLSLAAQQQPDAGPTECDVQNLPHSQSGASAGIECSLSHASSQDSNVSTGKSVSKNLSFSTQAVLNTGRHGTASAREPMANTGRQRMYSASQGAVSLKNSVSMVPTCAVSAQTNIGNEIKVCRVPVLSHSYQGDSGAETTGELSIHTSYNNQNTDGGFLTHATHSHLGLCDKNTLPAYTASDQTGFKNRDSTLLMPDTVSHGSPHRVNAGCQEYVWDVVPEEQYPHSVVMRGCTSTLVHTATGSTSSVVHASTTRPHLYTTTSTTGSPHVHETTSTTSPHMPVTTSTSSPQAHGPTSTTSPHVHGTTNTTSRLVHPATSTVTSTLVHAATGTVHSTGQLQTGRTLQLDFEADERFPSGHSPAGPSSVSTGSGGLGLPIRVMDITHVGGVGSTPTATPDHLKHLEGGGEGGAVAARHETQKSSRDMLLRRAVENSYIQSTAGFFSCQSPVPVVPSLTHPFIHRQQQLQQRGKSPPGQSYVAPHHSPDSRELHDSGQAVDVSWLRDNKPSSLAAQNFISTPKKNQTGTVDDERGRSEVLVENNTDVAANGPTMLRNTPVGLSSSATVVQKNANYASLQEEETSIGLSNSPVHPSDPGSVAEYQGPSTSQVKRKVKRRLFLGLQSAKHPSSKLGEMSSASHRPDSHVLLGTSTENYYGQYLQSDSTHGSVNSLVQADTGTVNSTSGCMHEGVTDSQSMHYTSSEGLQGSSASILLDSPGQTSNDGLSSDVMDSSHLSVPSHETYSNSSGVNIMARSADLSVDSVVLSDSKYSYDSVGIRNNSHQFEAGRNNYVAGQYTGSLVSNGSHRSDVNSPSTQDSLYSGSITDVFSHRLLAKTCSDGFQNGSPQCIKQKLHSQSLDMVPHHHSSIKGQQHDSSLHHQSLGSTERLNPLVHSATDTVHKGVNGHAPDNEAHQPSLEYKVSLYGQIPGSKRNLSGTRDESKENMHGLPLAKSQTQQHRSKETQYSESVQSQSHGSRESLYCPPTGTSYLQSLGSEEILYGQSDSRQQQIQGCEQNLHSAATVINNNQHHGSRKHECEQSPDNSYTQQLGFIENLYGHSKDNLLSQHNGSNTNTVQGCTLDNDTQHLCSKKNLYGQSVNSALSLHHESNETVHRQTVKNDTGTQQLSSNKTLYGQSVDSIPSLHHESIKTVHGQTVDSDTQQLVSKGHMYGQSEDSVSSLHDESNRPMHGQMVDNNTQQLGFKTCLYSQSVDSIPSLNRGSRKTVRGQTADNDTQLFGSKKCLYSQSVDSIPSLNHGANKTVCGQTLGNDMQQFGSKKNMYGQSVDSIPSLNHGSNKTIHGQMLDDTQQLTLGSKKNMNGSKESVQWQFLDKQFGREEILSGKLADSINPQMHAATGTVGSGVNCQSTVSNNSLSLDHMRNDKKSQHKLQCEQHTPALKSLLKQTSSIKENLELRTPFSTSARRVSFGEMDVREFEIPQEELEAAFEEISQRTDGPLDLDKRFDVISLRPEGPLAVEHLFDVISRRPGGPLYPPDERDDHQSKLEHTGQNRKSYYALLGDHTEQMAWHCDHSDYQQTLSDNAEQFRRHSENMEQQRTLSDETDYTQQPRAPSTHTSGLAEEQRTLNDRTNESTQSQYSKQMRRRGDHSQQRRAFSDHAMGQRALSTKLKTELSDHTELMKRHREIQLGRTEQQKRCTDHSSRSPNERTKKSRTGNNHTDKKRSPSYSAEQNVRHDHTEHVSKRDVQHGHIEQQRRRSDHDSTSLDECTTKSRTRHNHADQKRSPSYSAEQHVRHDHAVLGSRQFCESNQQRRTRSNRTEKHTATTGHTAAKAMPTSNSPDPLHFLPMRTPVLLTMATSTVRLDQPSKQKVLATSGKVDASFSETCMPHFSQPRSGGTSYPVKATRKNVSQKGEECFVSPDSKYKISEDHATDKSPRPSIQNSLELSKTGMGEFVNNQNISDTVPSWLLDMSQTSSREEMFHIFSGNCASSASSHLQPEHPPALHSSQSSTSHMSLYSTADSLGYTPTLLSTCDSGSPTSPFMASAASSHTVIACTSDDACQAAMSRETFQRLLAERKPNAFFKPIESHPTIRKQSET